MKGLKGGRDRGLEESERKDFAGMDILGDRLGYSCHRYVPKGVCGGEMGALQRDTGCCEVTVSQYQGVERWASSIKARVTALLVRVLRLR